MCFIVKKSVHIREMASLKREAKKNGSKYITVYKSVDIGATEKTLSSKIYGYIWYNGINVTSNTKHTIERPDSLKWTRDREYRGDRAYYAIVNKAFHAYRDLEKAFYMARNAYSAAILELSVHIDDVISVNESEIVFKKCTVIRASEITRWALV